MNIKTREELIKAIEKKILNLTPDFANYYQICLEAANGKGTADNLLKTKSKLFAEMVSRSMDYECAKYDTFKSIEETLEDLNFDDYEI